MIRYRSVLRVLCLETDSSAAANMRDRLEDGGYRVEWNVARDASDFSNSLSPGLDAVLCGSVPAEFSVVEALARLKSDGFDVPFIVFGADMSDDEAVELLDLGAADFIPKDRPAFLLPSVERAIAYRVSRKRQEGLVERLSEMRERFEAVADAAPGVMYQFVRDAQGRPRFTYVSEKIRTQFGMEPDEVVRDIWSMLDRFHPDDRPSLFTSIDASASSMQRWRWEGRFRVGTAYRWISGNSVPRKLDDGGILWNGMLTDITDRKRYELGLKNVVEHVKSVSNLKSSILTNMSHEIRTPLTGIIGFAEVIGDGDLTAEEIGTFARLISDEGKRLLRTMDSVLDLAQIKGGERKLELRPTDVSRQARAVVESFDYCAAQKDLTIQAETCKSECFVMADENILHRILTNLVSNAVKFTSEGGVTVSVSLDTSDVVIRVLDTGIGISEQSRDEIFEEFVQGSVGLDRDYDGIGLGLTITRELVLILGGTIEIDSEPGQGATFSVRLPAVGKKAEARSIEAPSSLTDEAAGPRRILVVDAAPDNRTLFTRMLSPECRVTAVEEQGDAIDVFRDTAFDAIIVDVELGESVRCLRFLSKIRNMPNGRAIPVVACSAYGEPGDEIRLREAGFADVLAKPFTRSELLSVIDSCLSAHLPTDL